MNSGIWKNKCPHGVAGWCLSCSRGGIASAFLIVLMAGCAITGPLFGGSPEAQIVTGANATGAAATLASVLLRNNKVTVTQAKGYSDILHSASAHLNAAGNALAACRAKTGSTQHSTPDPCAATVVDDIRLGIAIASEVNRTLSGKE